MLQVYKKLNKATITVDNALIGESYDFRDHWIHMSNPTDKEIELISRSAGVPEDMIKAALDEEERARIERDDDTGALLVVTDIPFTEEDEDHYTYTTLPFGFISTRHALGALRQGLQPAQAHPFPHTAAIHHLQKVRALPQTDRPRQPARPERFGEIHEERGAHRDARPREILRSNSVVLDKLPKMTKLFEEDEDLFEDVVIENKQAIEMSNIYRDILSGTMDAYASIISNNLNVVMKVLTSLTLLVAIPSMIGAFWGMNESWGFWVVIGISVVVCLVAGIVLWKKRFLK